MNETPQNNLTDRLVKLINQYPDCLWLKELHEMNLKQFPRPLTRVKIDNGRVDIRYNVFVSDN